MAKTGVVTRTAVVETEVKPGMFLVSASCPDGVYFVDYKYRCHWIDTDCSLNRCVEAGGPDARQRNWDGWKIVTPNFTEK